jgi:hypothetical protein
MHFVFSFSYLWFVMTHGEKINKNSAGALQQSRPSEQGTPKISAHLDAASRLHL